MTSEADVVRECTAYLDILKYARVAQYRIIHVPIPGKGTYVQNERARSMTGVNDCYVFLPKRQVWHVEFKRPGGKQSPAQREWQKDLEEVGHVYSLIHSRGELIQGLRVLFKLPEYGWDNGLIVIL